MSWKQQKYIACVQLCITGLQINIMPIGT